MWLVSACQRVQERDGGVGVLGGVGLAVGSSLHDGERERPRGAKTGGFGAPRRSILPRYLPNRIEGADMQRPLEAAGALVCVRPSLAPAGSSPLVMDRTRSRPVHKFMHKFNHSPTPCVWDSHDGNYK